jgi:hypothetical protein
LSSSPQGLAPEVTPFVFNGPGSDPFEHF